MNHYMRNGWKGDPELPTEYVSNPRIKSKFIERLDTQQMDYITSE